ADRSTPRPRVSDRRPLTPVLGDARRATSTGHRRLRRTPGVSRRRSRPGRARPRAVPLGAAQSSLPSRAGPPWHGPSGRSPTVRAFHPILTWLVGFFPGDAPVWAPLPARDGRFRVVSARE